MSRLLRRSALLLCIVPFWWGLASFAQISVSLPDLQVESTGTGEIVLSVGDLSGQPTPVTSYQFTIKYNPSILEITGATSQGTLSSSASPIVNTSAAGEITVAWASATALTGSGVLLKLKAKFFSEGVSQLTFVSFDFNEGDPPSTTSNGSVTVGSQDTGAVNVSLPESLRGSSGETITLPVTTSDLTGKDVTSYAFTVNFDPAHIQIGGAGVSGTLSEGNSVSTNTDTPGQITVTMAVGQTLTGSGTLINLQAELKAPGSSSLGFTSFQFNSGEPQALTSGGNIAVREMATHLQIAHNSSDASAVDVYINDVKVIDALSYAGVTPFLRLETSVIKLDVVRNDAANNAYPIASSSVSLEDNQDYVAVINGLYSGTGKQALDLVVKKSEQSAVDASKASMLVFQGSPDAPRINIHMLDDQGNPAQSLGESLDFGESYLSTEFKPGVFNVEIVEANGAQIGVYRANLNAMAGSNLLFMVQGFVNPNIGQPGLSVIVYTPEGRPTLLPVVTASEDESTLPDTFRLRGNYPNPFNPTTSIQFDLPEPAEVDVAIFDTLGREVLSLPVQRYLAGVEQSIQVDASSLASGTYVYRVSARGARQAYVSSKMMTLLK